MDSPGRLNQLTGSTEHGSKSDPVPSIFCWDVRMMEWIKEYEQDPFLGRKQQSQFQVFELSETYCI